MNGNFSKIFMLCLSVLIALTSCTQTDIYVSPNGDDTNPGTIEKPLATLAKAKNEARKINSSAKIILREGTYYLTEMKENRITEKIIQCAIKVHTALGPGLLESAYKECLFYELCKCTN